MTPSAHGACLDTGDGGITCSTTETIRQRGIISIRIAGGSGPVQVETGPTPKDGEDAIRVTQAQVDAARAAASPVPASTQVRGLAPAGVTAIRIVTGDGVQVASAPVEAGVYAVDIKSLGAGTRIEFLNADGQTSGVALG